MQLIGMNMPWHDEYLDRKEQMSQPSDFIEILFYLIIFVCFVEHNPRRTFITWTPFNGIWYRWFVTWSDHKPVFIELN